ncbi:hypothetical protein HDF18_00635 [Mucilaginibacter sp. X5P1]|nr:hypothetical protein [Mucilaginibacter sp. X5P1]MBB6138397.1 hypothetical protein [Mucilaginibacter sp. X5P1]
MKKLIIAATLIFTTGILASQTKMNNSHPASVSIQKFNISTEKKDLATAD